MGNGELTDARVAEYTDAKVAGYIAKYATKNAEGTGTVDRTLMCRPCAGRGYLHGPDGFHDRCADCDGTGQAEPIKALPVQQHVRQSDETTLVTASSWTYLSSGYRPGEELLAAQVRHDIANTQRLKHEGLVPA